MKYDVVIIGSGPAGLFAAGDGCGKSRGIVGAAISGMLAAKGLMRKTK